MTPHFKISNKETLIDDIIDVELCSLIPHALTTIRAQFTDDQGQTWASECQFRSDANGSVKLQSAQPLAGSYEQADSTGLFWSMQCVDGCHSFSRPALNSLSPLSVQLSTEVEGTIVAETALTRHFVRSDIRQVEVREAGVVAVLFMPKDSEPKTTIVVYGGSGGGFTWSKQVASLLASRGCAAMAVAYFDWNGAFGLPDQFIELTLDGFEKVWSYLADQTSLNLDNLTLIGFSKGAEKALLLATLYAQIKRVIAYVPTSLVGAGFSRQESVEQSCWSYRGETLPFALFPNGRFDESSWQDHAMIEAATIPVEKITAPMLLISATEDRVWPSTRMAQDIMTRMDEHGCDQHRQHLLLDGAGHSLSVPGLPTIVYGGVDAAINAQAERQAWNAVLAFLDL